MIKISKFVIGTILNYIAIAAVIKLLMMTNTNIIAIVLIVIAIVCLYKK